MFVGVLVPVRVQSDVIGTARWSYLACHWTKSWWDGYIAPSMAVADGTTMVCAARWSHIASGDGMVYEVDFIMAAFLSWWDG